MSRRFLFFIISTGIALGVIFLAGYTINNGRRLTADLTAVGRSQNTVAPSASASLSTTPTLTDVLQEIQDQQQLLTKQVANIQARLAIIDLNNVFTRTMQLGDSGKDVSRLQELLKKISGLYPSGADGSSTVTGPG